MRKASLGTIFLTVFLDLLGFGLVVPFLPGVARDLGASDLVASLLGAAFSLMQFVFIPFWGRLSDRWGRRPVLLLSIAASAVGMAGLGFANTLALLFVARLFSGMATANIAVAQAYIADVTTPETRAKGMGMIGMAFGLGFIFGPLMGGLLGHVEVFGRQGPLAAFVAAGLSVVNLLLAFRFLPESRQPGTRASAAVAKRRSPIDFGALRQVTQVPGLGRAAALVFVGTFFFAGLEVTFRLFTMDVFSLSVSGTGYVFVMVGVIAAYTQGRLIGKVTRRFGEVRVLFRGQSILAFGFALIALSAFVGSLGSWAAWTAFLAGSALVAFGNGLTTPSLSSYSSRQAPSEIQGMTMGVMQSLGALARATGPFVAGGVYQYVGAWGPYALGAVGLSAAAWMARGLPALQTSSQDAAAAVPQETPTS